MTDDVATAEEIVRLSRNYKKPVLACFMGADIVSKGVEILRVNKIPQYPIPERAAHTMLEMVTYAQYKVRKLRMVERFAVNKNPVIKILRMYRWKNRYEIGEFDAKADPEGVQFRRPERRACDVGRRGGAFRKRGRVPARDENFKP